MPQDPKSQPCADCRGSGSITCPTCQGTGGTPDDACCACGGNGELQCFRCAGTGREPATAPAPAGDDTSVALPWGTARIIEVVNIAGHHHQPSLELLEFPNGDHALRFNAFFDGDPVNGPLVLDQSAIVHLACAAAGTRIQTLLKALASGEVEED